MDLSVIIPVFNSELILKKLIHEIDKIRINKDLEMELILVNDFSFDNSWAEIKKLSKNYDYLKGINLKENYGQHNAISAGLTYSKGKYIILMDDDFQHDPIYIINILDELKKGFDACYVKYLKRKHNVWKRFLSYLNHISSSYLSNKPFNIYTSSFKGINRRLCEIIKEDNNFEVFLDWIIVGKSKNIQTINIFHRERLEGKTNYGIKKLLILWSNMIIKIKPKNKFKLIILFILKLFIKYILHKLLNKRVYKEKFSILEKTFN
jgi:undecaprenyl-phosphate 4-deoxy-4-formamido-L-arabinose transferase